MSKKRRSLFDALADKSQKPDALGFQPFDQRKLKALGFNVFDEDEDDEQQARKGA